MRAVFRGWRRKSGVLTLLMACAFTGLWARSDETSDVFGFPIINGMQHSIESTCEGIRSIRSTPLPRTSSIGWVLKKIADRDRNPRRESVNDFWEYFDVDWRWDWAGFHFGGGKLKPFFLAFAKLDSGKAECSQIPYWSIVTPLTLLSAWLLLSKPRTPNPKAEACADESPAA
jgi:hypothetical protein